MNRITDAAVRNAKPRTERYELREASGLALRVTPGGAKSWVWRYRFEGKQKRLTFGTYPHMTLSQARTELATAQDKLARKIDPIDDRPSGETVADLIELYRQRHLPKLRSAPHQERRLQVDILPALGHLRLGDVTRRRIGDLIYKKAATGPVSANRVRSLIIHLFKCGVEWGLLESSPATMVSPAVEEKARDKVLSDEQLAKTCRIIESIRDVRISRILQLLLFTGQRVTEVCGMTKSEIDLKKRLWILPASRAKNAREHIIPLNDLALAVVLAAVQEQNGQYVFPAISKRQPYVHRHSIGQAWRRLCRINEIDGVTPHDIRRTVATGMGKLGVQPHVIEAVLNHVSGHKAGVAGIYQRHDYLEEKRQALAAWGSHIAGLRNAG